MATSYITYLNRVLEGDQDPSGGFRAELVPSSRKINAERRAKLEAQVIGNSTYSFRFKKNQRHQRLPTHVNIENNRKIVRTPIDFIAKSE